MSSSHIRTAFGILGVLVAVVFIGNAVANNIQPTPALEIAETLRFYREAGSAWSMVWALVGIVFWMFGGLVHAIMLCFGKPQRPLTIFPITGLVIIVLSGEASFSGKPELIGTTIWLLFTQALDLFLPPYPSWQGKEAKAN